MKPKWPIEEQMSYATAMGIFLAMRPELFGNCSPGTKKQLGDLYRSSVRLFEAMEGEDYELAKELMLCMPFGPELLLGWVIELSEKAFEPKS